MFNRAVYTNFIIETSELIKFKGQTGKYKGLSLLMRHTLPPGESMIISEILVPT